MKEVQMRVKKSDRKERSLSFLSSACFHLLMTYEDRVFQIIDHMLEHRLDHTLGRLALSLRIIMTLYSALRLAYIEAMALSLSRGAKDMPYADMPYMPVDMPYIRDSIQIMRRCKSSKSIITICESLIK
ncbi:hypothetical protein CEXT_487161 [Caerostris extrusa]|uniref:Uncharacterized protein n=1 Tax=Caerostris extrusa TaxID=172846 RepID=A0AAV4MH44_CAEEX|nr:hypothetical protein CEXT_487161 [Caerostris extrusa]